MKQEKRIIASSEVYSGQKTVFGPECVPSPNYRIEPGSPVSARMAQAVWEIPEVSEEFTPEDVHVYLKALMAWLDTMEQIAWIEHTGDWDPYLRITLKDGTILRTELHYYLINRVTQTTLFIEAPDGSEAPEASDPILKFYDKETFEYRVPITEIVRIEIQ